ncbi:MAG: diguanylate cyclase [Thermoanaerobaculia bacterium]
MTGRTERRRKDDRKSVAAERLTVLIVDDDSQYRAWIAALLQRFGLDVVFAEDGQAALQFLREGGPCDLVLLDLRMPKLDGFKTVEAIRADPELLDLFVVMLTVASDEKTRIDALNDGFDDFLPKAASREEILAKINSYRRVIDRQAKLVRKNQRLYRLAMRDDLTGLFNRRYFFEEASRAMLSPLRPMAIALFDLDDFKEINDKYGHYVGDRILADVGAAFHQSARYGDLIGRYGGDEFIMLIAGAPIDQVVEITERIAQTVASLQWTVDTDMLGIGVTSGISSTEYLKDGTLEQLVRACDHDLYRNKWSRKHPESLVSDAEPEEPGVAAEPESLPPRLDRLPQIRLVK